ncbi:MAG: hypothetical protein U9R27_12435 [Campylobacterota bacterium]|nr:hypothetical protein [Campylobacterota bacterium]
MQFDKDINSRFAKNFLKIREILLSYEEIREQKNAKQTAYYGPYSSICFLRANKQRLTLAFAQGYKLQEKYPLLQGDGKIVRHLYFKEDCVVDKILLREMIEESIVLTLEAHEMRLLKRSQNRVKT